MQVPVPTVTKERLTIITHILQQLIGFLVDKRPGVHPETYGKRSTFVSRIKSWWPFQKSNAKADDSTDYQNKATSNLEDFKLPELDQPASNLEKA